MSNRVVPAPGMMVAGRFRLLRMMGQGGMGSVWAAHHVTLDSEVALKFIDPDISDRAEILSRFAQEAMAAAKIKSPHVVNIFDHGIDEQGRPFIAMELLKGEDLATRLERTGPLALDAAAEVIRQAAKGLHKAHAAGIVHRDIKPENIFLVDDDDGSFTVKLLDFGIAKSQHFGAGSTGHKTATGQIIGTPTYMSPEQALGRSLDFRSDLYSLAVVAYRAVAGRPPFEYDAVGELIVAVSTLPAPPPSKFRSDLPASVDLWFERALMKDPSHRWPSAKALGDSFVSACGGTPSDPSLFRGDVASRPSFPESQMPGSGSGPISGARSGPFVEAPTMRFDSPTESAPVSAQIQGERTPTPAEAPRESGNATKLMFVVAAVVVLSAGAFVALRRTAVDVRAPAPAPSNVEAPTIAVHIAVSPPSAVLSWDGVPLGQNPFAGTKPLDNHEHVLRADAPGFKPVERSVVADRPIDVQMVLEGVSLSPLPSTTASPQPSTAAPTPIHRASGSGAHPIVPPPASASAPEASSAAPRPEGSAHKKGVTLDKDDPWAK